MSEYWHDGMTWKEFLAIRNDLPQPGLIKYVDKIEQQKIAEEAGIEVPKTYIATREKTPILDIISDLPSYVAKPIHLSFGRGLIIVKDGIDIVTGEQVTPEQVQESMFKSLEIKQREKDTWALYQVEPGFMIQEYIPNREEVQILTIWGRAVIGIWRGGEGKRRFTRHFGQYERNGKRLRGRHKAPKWWSKAIDTAELIAKGTDALRVDLLVKKNDVFLLNEFGLCPENHWANKKIIEDSLNEGYRKLTENNEETKLT